MGNNYLEEIHTFKGLHGFPSRCFLRIYKTGEKTVIIATELRDNPGTSITNYAAQLATGALQTFNVQPEQLVWVEHYPAGDTEREGEGEDTYDIVTFTWNGDNLTTPVWRHSNKKEVETITGTTITPIPARSGLH